MKCVYILISSSAVRWYDNEVGLLAQREQTYKGEKGAAALRERMAKVAVPVHSSLFP